MELKETVVTTASVCLARIDF